MGREGGGGARVAGWGEGPDGTNSEGGSGREGGEGERGGVRERERK